jgi:hypothetical protein
VSDISRRRKQQNFVTPEPDEAVTDEFLSRDRTSQRSLPE